MSIDFNPEQKKAIALTKGPLLIVAGPGAGKTHVLIWRIANLLQQGIPAKHILAITFTNKAAGEMKDRIGALLASSPEVLKKLTIGTFHALGIGILRKEVRRMGLEPTFTIYDRADQLSLLKRIWNALGLKENSLTPGTVLEAISQAKNELIDAKDYASRAEVPSQKLIGQLYYHYQEELAKAVALDFDDLILKTVQLFETCPDLLKKYQDRFRYINVDEWQDTNTSQYRLIYLLAKEYRNLAVIGDPDQSIYSWRSADFRNMLNFQKDYPDVKVVTLEQNYRSTKTILGAAQGLITHNQWRVQKELWTKNKKGEAIKVIASPDEKLEARWIVRTLKKLKCPLSDVAIFFRLNLQSRPLEEVLIQKRIPYRTVGLTRFYDRKEVRDILAYLRLLENPSDTVSLARIINVPARGLGKDTFKTIAPYQKILLEPGKIPEDLKERLNKKTIKNLSGFLSLYQILQREIWRMPLNAFIELILNQTGYQALIEKSDNLQDRAGILEELISLALQFQGSAKETIGPFLERAALYTQEHYEQGQGVNLMTVHAAKGLEFPIIFITGLEYGLFPHYKSLASQSQLEEERRLCYVAMTRAQERLFLTYAKTRTIYGRTQANPPSNFLEEIPPQFLSWK